MDRNILSHKFILLITLLIFNINSFSQEFNKEQQYQQAMANAKMAFSAKKYSEAVVFYREALKIKPEAQLPRYKIEDIRTIYIEKELAKLEPKHEKQKKRDKKETKPQEDPIRKQAEIQADQIIAAETKIVENEMQELKIEAKAIDINDEDKIAIDTAKVNSIEPDRQTVLQKKESIVQSNIDSPVAKNPDISIKTIENKQVKVENIQPVDTVKKQPEVKKPIQKSIETAKAPTQMSAEEKKVWKQKEQERLKVIYPNKKTIEEIDKPGKHITRVIMNVNDEVLIYLRVKHDWGGLFFFIDNPGEDLRSISEQYFNQMTNLNTYGN
jgi:hypothetical protein